MAEAMQSRVEMMCWFLLTKFSSRDNFAITGMHHEWYENWTRSSAVVESTHGGTASFRACFSYQFHFCTSPRSRCELRLRHLEPLCAGSRARASQAVVSPLTRPAAIVLSRPSFPSRFPLPLPSSSRRPRANILIMQPTSTIAETPSGYQAWYCYDQ